MAQTSKQPDDDFRRRRGVNMAEASNLSVSVPATGNTTLLTMQVAGLERIFVQLSVATQALDAFIISAKATPDASFATLYDAAADFTTPVGLMVGAGRSDSTTGDLTTLAAGASGWFILDVIGLSEVKIEASAAVDSAVVSIYAGGQ